jgi:hypothetical protein
MRPWMGIALLLLVSAAVSWPFVNVPSVGKAGERRQEWELAAVKRADPAKSLEVLAKVSPWGKLPEAAESQAPERNDWRISAIYTRGAERVVVVKVGTRPEQRLKVGEALPEGSTILQISDDSLCVLVNGVKRKLPIHPRREIL